MKQIQIKPYNIKPPKELPKVDHHEMKAKIKSLKDEMVRLNYKVNGYDHSICGKVKKLYRVQLDFKMNAGMLLKIRYEYVTNIKLIKL